MSLRPSATAVVERNVEWSGAFASEPWEAAWAREAIFFLRRLDGAAESEVQARVQLSPDGIHWVDEGSRLHLRAGAELALVRVREFGGWLRLAGDVTGEPLRVILYLSLKG